jgi:integrase
MKGKRLSAIELKNLLPGMHADGEGLYLNVQESGSRSWILRTVVRGKRTDIGIGGIATTSLAKAREKATALREKARKGEDILEARRIEKRVIPTFKEAALTYHGRISETFDSERHSQNWIRSLELYVFPVIGSRTVDMIDTADVLRAIGPIWNEVPDTARRTLRRVKAIFDYCQVSGYRNIMVGSLPVSLPNPCEIRAALPNNHIGEGHHAALPYQKLPKFIADLREISASLSVKLGFEFLILTAARTGEVIHATWAEINLEARTWTIPAQRMKMGIAHQVPLSDRCVEILSQTKQFNEGKILFQSSKPDTPLSNTCFLMALRRMGHNGITAHGFRATFKTWAEEKTKFDSLVIEASMAHQVKGIERHYLRTTFFEKRMKLMAAWSKFASSLSCGDDVNTRSTKTRKRAPN